MFGLSLRERATEALERGTKAILIGGFFHVTDAAKFDLNEEASGYLYTEAQAHQVYVLIAICGNTVGDKPWATRRWVIKAIGDVAMEYEVEHGISPGTITSFIFRRVAEIDQLTPQERADGMQFVQSANRVFERDSSANKQKIVSALNDATREYFGHALRMFKS